MPRGYPRVSPCEPPMGTWLSVRHWLSVRQVWPATDRGKEQRGGPRPNPVARLGIFGGRMKEVGDPMLAQGIADHGAQKEDPSSPLPGPSKPGCPLVRAENPQPLTVYRLTRGAALVTSSGRPRIGGEAEIRGVVGRPRGCSPGRRCPGRAGRRRARGGCGPLGPRSAEASLSHADR